MNNHCCCHVTQLQRENAQLRLANAHLKIEIDRLENALDLVPNPEVTPGQPRPNHCGHCCCGGRHG